MRFVPFLALMAFASPSFAQDSAAPASKADKKVCRMTAQTGSILGGKRECHTKAEWAAISERARTDRDNRDMDNRSRSAVSDKSLRGG
ncbi:MAG: hypothetical protein EOP60_20060 [Sphingomonadales bacterium]|nr:MAG: hypothetical protein EOP60_20060 [Sphingomonadales bacterium]